MGAVFWCILVVMLIAVYFDQDNDEPPGLCAEEEYAEYIKSRCALRFPLEMNR